MKLTTELKTALSELMELCFEKSVDGNDFTFQIYGELGVVYVYHYDKYDNQTHITGENILSGADITLNNIKYIKQRILEITND